MRVDFYQLSRDPVERVVPLLAGKVLQAGARLLLVAESEAVRLALAQALWDQNDTLLANGMAGEVAAERQPVLLSAECEAPNGARMICLADGRWRENAARFERALLLFPPEATGDTRELWRTLGDAGHELHIHKQADNGAWREGA